MFSDVIRNRVGSRQNGTCTYRNGLHDVYHIRLRLRRYSLLLLRWLSAMIVGGLSMIDPWLKRRKLKKSAGIQTAGTLNLASIGHWYRDDQHQRHSVFTPFVLSVCAHYRITADASRLAVEDDGLRVMIAGGWMITPRTDDCLAIVRAVIRVGSVSLEDGGQRHTRDHPNNTRAY